MVRTGLKRHQFHKFVHKIRDKKSKLFYLQKGGLQNRVAIRGFQKVILQELQLKSRFFEDSN